MRSPYRLFIWLVVAAAVSGCGYPRGTQGDPRPTRAEAQAGRAYQASMHRGPQALRAFLTELPKGADLHVHLSGAVYAETFIREAAEDGICVDTVALGFDTPPCGRGKLVPAGNFSGNMTPANQAIYDKLIDSFSMRGFVPYAEWSGHDQFFATFVKFSGLKNHVGEWVDEVAARAAAQNQQYLELMQTPRSDKTIQHAQKIGWSPDLQRADGQAFAAFRQKLLDDDLRKEVDAGRDSVRKSEADRRQSEHCDTAQPAPACKVEIRYIFQVSRGKAPEQVFAQTLVGFEIVQATMDAAKTGKDGGGFVGLNLVQPEDGFISMRDYTLQMKMLDYLHSVYPKVHISLHAGELAEGLVPPEGLRFHIRQAVELGHAERIGHGVDIMHEDNADELLKELAGNHVMVEINLSSNEGILQVKGNQHPFPIYMRAHVPVALSTDDEGVSRIDLTNEYVRAAIDYHLTYMDLKHLARTGMEHSFLSGTSLWAKPDDFTAAAGDCKDQTLGADQPSSACKSFLDSNEKAAAQWELERRFRVFEAKFESAPAQN